MEAIVNQVDWSKPFKPIDSLIKNYFPFQGCSLADLKLVDICSHSAAAKIFTDSIHNKNKYTSYPCENWQEFLNGNCLQCDSAKGCNRMGFWSSPINQQGTLYLNTRSLKENSFYKQNLLITLISAQMSKQAKGTFKIFFKGNGFTSPPVVLDNSNKLFKADSKEKIFLSLDDAFSMEEINSVSVSYERNFNWLANQSKWTFKCIEIFSGDSQKTFKFCPQEEFFHTGNYNDYTKC